MRHDLFGEDRHVVDLTIQVAALRVGVKAKHHIDPVRLAAAPRLDASLDERADLERQPALALGFRVRPGEGRQ